MLQRGVMFLMLTLCFAGCAATHKSHAKAASVMTVSGQDNLSANAKDKVWIEAETRKVWVNSHVDENGDMVEGHYKHIIITPGHWAVKEVGKD